MNSEIDWIRSITPQKNFQSSLQVGIGDDAAIYSDDLEKETVIAVDTMVEGVHFTRGTMPLKAIGYKALAVNISDLAAMGATPLFYLVSIAIPKAGWQKEELNEIYTGMEELANHYKIDLIGGDTVSIEKNLVITVTAIGKVEKGRRLLRSNAKVGDVVFVTGPIGHSALGLEHLLQNGYSKMDDKELEVYVHAHQFPVPQVESGRLLAKSGFNISLNDISDGLASEAKEIAYASKVSVEIEWDKIPKTPRMKAAPIKKQEDWILYGGEDFQLIGTVASEYYSKLKQLFEEQQLAIHTIGKIIPGQGEVILLRNNEKVVLTKTGYHHL